MHKTDSQNTDANTPDKFRPTKLCNQHIHTILRIKINLRQRRRNACPPKSTRTGNSGHGVLSTDISSHLQGQVMQEAYDPRRLRQGRLLQEDSPDWQHNKQRPCPEGCLRWWATLVLEAVVAEVGRTCKCKVWGASSIFNQKKTSFDKKKCLDLEVFFRLAEPVRNLQVLHSDLERFANPSHDVFWQNAELRC